MKSQPLSISRYSNGTLVKLSVSDSAFVSYDFDPEKNTGTYTPTSITITPTFSGGVKFGSWRYSTDGATFQNVVSGQHGFTINGGAVILAATSDLYATTNSAVIVACVGDDPTYFDTVTIMRYVDPTFVFRQTSTAIKQTNDKISLIATEEQLEKYGSKFTVLDDLQAQIDVIPSKISLAVKGEHGIITGEMNTALAEYATLETMESRLDITAKDITSSVAKTYQTKSDAVEALQEAKDYADGQVDDVQATLRSEIKQSADSITSNVSATYQTKSDAEDDLDKAKAYARNQDTTLKSEIKQTTDSISTEVSKKVGNNEIISKINQSAETIKIDASKVNITGFVTFDNLEEDGQSVINGANITTGIIHDANNNTSIDLSTGKITTKKLVIDAENFKLTEKGVMTCYGGTFYGSVYAGGGARGVYLKDGTIYFSPSGTSWTWGSNIQFDNNTIKFNSSVLQGIGFNTLYGNAFFKDGIEVGSTSPVLDLTRGNVWTNDSFRLKAGVTVHTSLGTGQTISTQKLLTGFETTSTSVVTGHPTLDSTSTNVLTDLSGASTSNVLYGGTLVQIKIPTGVKLNYSGQPELTYPSSMPYGGYYVFSAKPSQKTFWLPSNSPSHVSRYLISSGSFSKTSITHYKSVSSKTLQTQQGFVIKLS